MSRQLRDDSVEPRSSLTDNRSLKTDNYFEIDVSASRVELGDYGFASGYVKLSGTELDPRQITVIGEINELELDGYDFRLLTAHRSDLNLIRTEQLRMRKFLLSMFRYISHHPP